VSIVFRSSSSDPFVVRAGQRITMHATDGAGNTSEHSRSVVAKRYEPAVRCNFSRDC
jgi:hypothetical protein